MALQDDYEVRLSSFQGPLDLLLFLVRRSEVDISDIPISMITEQYFGFLKNIHRVDVELAGEFLVMAATLVEIKSRTLAPRAPSQIDTTGENRREAADPRFELVQQLLAYQQFRTAAGALDRLRLESARRYVAGSHGGGMIPDTDENEFSVEIEDAHVLDLVESFERIMQSVDISRLGDHRIEYDDTPISLHQADLVDRLAHSERRRMTMQQIFTGRSRGEMIGLFLALLELARQQQVAVRQDDGDADIEIELLQLSPEPGTESVSPVLDSQIAAQESAD
ncbi:MAG: segregation/condensation protein A [Planctomycetota bacterium]|nr:chromosome segregation protein ScpA [Planctomycetota bacterium]